MKNLTLLRNILVFALASIGCGDEDQGSSQRDSRTLAEVNGTRITESDFRYWWNRDPRAKDNLETRAETLEALIRRRALISRARELGLHQDPEVIGAIDSLLIAKLHETQLQPEMATAEVSEREVREVYEAEKIALHTVPASRRVAILWFDTRGQKPLAERYAARLEKARVQALNNQAELPGIDGFGALAISNSEHMDSRYQGGDLGWLNSPITHDPIRSIAYEIAQNLDHSGEISEVIIREEGVFLVRLTAIRGAQTVPFESARSKIMRRLMIKKREMVRKRFEARALEGIPITRHTNHLDTIANLTTVESRIASTFGPSVHPASNTTQPNTNQ